MADVQTNASLLPCSARSETRIIEPYGVAVGNIALRAGRRTSVSADDRKYAEDINESVFKQLDTTLREHNPGIIGVGRTCDHDIQSADGREEYLAGVLRSLGGQFAISMTLTIEGSSFVVPEVELDIGSPKRWNEAAELAGYYTFSAGGIGAPLGPDDSAFASAVAELLAPYIDLLRAVADYAGSNYKSAIEVLRQVIGTAGASDRLKQLAYVLLGNSEGRSASSGSLERAEAAYHGALALSSSYPRATLGLAEVDYQKALAQIRRTGKMGCEGVLDPAGLKLLSDAYTKYSEVYANADSVRVSDVDARAKYGMGRIDLCRFLLGEQNKANDALSNLQYVTKSFGADKNKTWLQSAASGAYGDIGLLYCILGNRELSRSNYQNALDFAVDGQRHDQYSLALSEIDATKTACT